MSTLSQRLIAHERRSAADAGEAARAAFLVCDRLRRPLCVLAGIAGYRALLARSLALARARAPWLVEVKIAPDAALDFPPEAAARLAPAEFERGGALLVSEFLGLLSVLIGDTLTLRLVSNAWPDLQPPPSETEMDHHE
jgi:hypothetical protein